MIHICFKTTALYNYNCRSFGLINFGCIFAQKSCIVIRIRK
jgi:hypothetical protein